MGSRKRFTQPLLSNPPDLSSLTSNYNPTQSKSSSARCFQSNALKQGYSPLYSRGKCFSAKLGCLPLHFMATAGLANYWRKRETSMRKFLF